MAPIEYDAELASEAKQLRKMLGCEEVSPTATTGMTKKTSYHFTDQDGKIYVSLIKEVNKSCFKKSMAFLRMMNDIRILELCTDDTHIVLDVDHCREWFFSKANLSLSLLPPHWTSMNLWNTMIHFPVMAPEKFTCLLLFNASYESLSKFSLVDFVRSTSALNNIDMLKIALDNLQTVYQCIFDPYYKDICTVPKAFLQTNVRVLEIRDFKFVLDVFNKAFVNFQVDMRNRNVEIPSSTPLNTHHLVVECFVQWFTFTADMFSQEAEAVFKNRPRFLSGGEVDLKTTESALKLKKPIELKSTTVAKSSGGHVVSKPPKNPCIRHLAASLGLKELGGEDPVLCHHGSNCRYLHCTLPLGKFQRKSVMDFITSSTNRLLSIKAERDMLLKKL